MALKKSTKKSTKQGPKVKIELDGDFDEMCQTKACCGSSCKQTGGCFYGLGFIGAAVYYITTATGFWMGVWGVIKALFWPAFLVFHLMRLLGI